VQIVVRWAGRRSAVVLVSLLTLAVLLAGCGGSSGGSPQSSASPGGGSIGGAGAGNPTPTATPLVGIQAQGALAPYLVGPNGHTLYVFAKDTSNHSACTGTCIDNWPPLFLASDQEASAAPDAKGTLNVIDRPGSGRQMTYNGWPLYYFKSDAAPGDTNGNGVQGLWKVATPDLAAAPASP
jgi:predicted lipoprotein with Yx(FWY)xxD motif